MGTRATVKFYNSKPTKETTPLVCLYYQFDGYYEGVGIELADWLASKALINGISGQKMEEGFANGMGCLVAQFIANQKTEIGSFYVTDIDDEQGYDYEVWADDKKLVMRIDDFEGDPKDFEKFIKDNKGDDDEQ